MSHYTGSPNYHVQHILAVDLLLWHSASSALLNGLLEEVQLTLWCQEIWTDTAMVRHSMVLHDIVPLVRLSRSPVISELLLQFSAPKSVETHVHCFGAFWLDGVGDATHHCRVISVHGRRELWMSHLFKRMAYGDGFL